MRNYINQMVQLVSELQVIYNKNCENDITCKQEKEPVFEWGFSVCCLFSRREELVVYSICKMTHQIQHSIMIKKFIHIPIQSYSSFTSLFSLLCMNGMNRLDTAQQDRTGFWRSTWIININESRTKTGNAQNVQCTQEGQIFNPKAGEQVSSSDCQGYLINHRLRELTTLFRDLSIEMHLFCTFLEWTYKIQNNRKLTKYNNICIFVDQLACFLQGFFKHKTGIPTGTQFSFLFLFFPLSLIHFHKCKVKEHYCRCSSTGLSGSPFISTFLYYSPPILSFILLFSVLLILLSQRYLKYEQSLASSSSLMM